MSTPELMKIVQARGLRIVLKGGQPVLVQPQNGQGVTDNLLKVLKFHRARIIEELSR